MIGRVIFQLDGNRAEATLDDDGRWSCPALPTLARVLDLRFSPSDHSPADGIYGLRQVAEAAEYLDGARVLPGRLPGPAATDD